MVDYTKGADWAVIHDSTTITKRLFDRQRRSIACFNCQAFYSNQRNTSRKPTTHSHCPCQETTTPFLLALHLVPVPSIKIMMRRFAIAIRIVASAFAHVSEKRQVVTAPVATAPGTRPSSYSLRPTSPTNLLPTFILQQVVA